jgi:probable HAF family extracellular repeat protein
VVGFAYTTSGEQHPFLWTAADGMADLGTLGGTASIVAGVTASGQVAGSSLTSVSGQVHAALWGLSTSDTTAPTATISVPVDGATYDIGSTVAADYSCSDNVALAVTDSCVGTVPDGSNLDTSVIGTHSFSVTATDAVGLTATTYSSYTVSGTLAAGLALTGEFTSIPVGYTVTAVDAGADGVTITVTGVGTEKVVMSVCAGFTVRIAPGSTVTLACGSVIAHVVAGSVVVELSNAAGVVTMTVLADGIATLKDNGDVVVPPESAVAVSVTIDGVTQSVTPGHTSDSLAPTAAPSVAPLPNAAGWNRTNVTVAWHWSDEIGGSGINSAQCTDSSVSSGEGPGIVVSAGCTDQAGNVATASVPVKVDRTPPAIVCPTSAKRGFNAVGSTLTAAVTDVGGSGTTSPSVTVAAPANVAGARSVNVTASDVAGNTTTVACGYQVIYTVQWLIPVGGTASAKSVTRNTVVPFTFRVIDAKGAAVTSAVVTAPTSTVIACPSVATPPLGVSVSGNASTRNLGSGWWLAGWKADTAWKGTCRSIRIGLSDGTTITAIYKVV